MGEIDNRLALDHLIQRCEGAGIGWMLYRNSRTNAMPTRRYELRIFDGPASGIYHGRTATQAATEAMAVLDAHKIGWQPCA